LGGSGKGFSAKGHRKIGGGSDRVVVCLICGLDYTVVCTFQVCAHKGVNFTLSKYIPVNLARKCKLGFMINKTYSNKPELTNSICQPGSS
jgi:hypothetical protein